jgi:predicted phage terminase large subunit-like protein
VIVNTRWHEEDLAGMVLKHHPDDDWQVVKLQAIENEGTDHEEACWPERFPLKHLQELRDSYMRSHPREWFSLYQQQPRSEQGTFIKREWFTSRWDKKHETMNVYVVSDFAITEAREGKDPDYTEHGVFGLAPDDKLYVLDWWSGQTTTDVWVEELLRLIKQWKPLCWFGEGGVVGKAIEPIMTRMMRERRVYCRTERLSPIHDKATRGRAFQGRAHAGLVVFPRTPWAERIIDQCVAFPGGAHDDAFDVMSWMGLAIDQAHPAIVRAAPLRPRRHDYTIAREEEGWKTA